MASLSGEQTPCTRTCVLVFLYEEQGHSVDCKPIKQQSTRQNKDLKMEY